MQHFPVNTTLLKKTHMKYLFFSMQLLVLSSCWTKIKPTPQPNQSVKVWGYKPVYGIDSSAKKIIYSNIAQPVIVPGNIYVKDNYIYQLEET